MEEELMINEKILTILKRYNIINLKDITSTIISEIHNSKNITIMEWNSFVNELESLGIFVEEEKLTIEELNISNKVKKIFKNIGIKYIDDINGKNIEEIKNIKGISTYDLNKLKKVCEDLGIFIDENGFFEDIYIKEKNAEETKGKKYLNTYIVKIDTKQISEKENENKNENTQNEHKNGGER